ncbi:MAG: hypothetical protein AAF569_03795 [Pseudomonadota bacterium]
MSVIVSLCVIIIFMICCGGNHHKKQAKPRDTESGSIIIWILVAVALFAALNFAFTKGFRTGEATVSDEKARLLATEIVDYGRTVQQAVRLLQINGCDETEVSFDQAIVSGYSNSNAPADNSCHVFNPGGGGLNWSSTALDIQDSDFSYEGLDDGYGTWLYAYPNVVDVGINGRCELVAFLNWIPRNVCIQINEKLGIDNPSGEPPREADWAGRQEFIGVYDISCAQISTPAGDFEGKLNGCYEGNHPNQPNGSYHFYQVLIVR